MFESEEFTVVIDAGSQNTVSGFAGEVAPRSVVPTAVGRFRHSGVLDGFPEIYCGHEAIQKRGLSKLTWPVEEGLISDWEEMEKLWFHVFYKELHVPPEQSKILHSVHPLVQKKDREKMAEVLFELFAVNGMNLVKSPALVLYASGRTTGLVYENGYSCSYITPVFEGFPLTHGTVKSPLTGQALSERLRHMLSSLGYSFTMPWERSIIDNIKETLCYVASDAELEAQKFQAGGEGLIKYDLPDGQYVLLGAERYLCPEILFQPSLIGNDGPNIVDMINASIAQTDVDYRPIMYQNIVLGGGTTMLNGLMKRLLRELNLKQKKSGGTNDKIAIDQLPSRQNAVWAGGSMMASLSTLAGFWMTKREYEDLGPDRVNYKFF